MTDTFDIRNSAFEICPFPLMTGLRGSAFPITEGTPQVASNARDNNANFAGVHHVTRKTKITSPEKHLFDHGQN